MANLREAVKDIIIDELSGYDLEDATQWFDNAENYCCANGCIGALVYYSDTEPFAREYHDEIVELMEEYGASPMRANDMAWFGFEANVPTLKDEVLEELYLTDSEKEEMVEEIAVKLVELTSEKDGNINSQLVEILDEVKSNMGLN